jgi:hypothetical protein
MIPGDQGYQMVCFETKNHNFGKIRRALEWKLLLPILYDRLEYFTAVWYNLWPFGIGCGHLVYFYVLLCFDQEKYGNLAGDCRSRGQRLQGWSQVRAGGQSYNLTTKISDYNDGDGS